ncbi:MAG: hypothetical protein HYZ37_10915 [Candidatus Solibacter usitatus]|nr:hypothetical protein [Candidatus Solibacter usitatus]
MQFQNASVDLSRFDEAYESAAIGDQSSPVPDGEYTAVVHQLEIKEGSYGASPSIVWTFRITNGEWSDQLLQKRRPVMDRSLSWIKEDFTKCGLEFQRLSDLPQHIPELIGREMRIAKRTKDGFVNVHILWSAVRAISD